MVENGDGFVSISGNWEKRRIETTNRLGSIDRRTFIKLSSAGAAALIFGAGPFTERLVAASSFSGYPFKLGVASGDPQPDGMVLWTRLAPEPLAEDGRGGMPQESVAVRWQVAADENFGRILLQGTVYAQPELAHSVHVEVRGLRPNRPYFYRFKAGSEISPVGKTKTTPALGAAIPRMRFSFASCQMYEHGYYTAYWHMAQEDLDLVVHLGDYIYEYGPNEYVAPDWKRAHPQRPECLFTSRVPQPPRPIPPRQGFAGGARSLPVDGDLGRPRGREQLHRRASRR